MGNSKANQKANTAARARHMRQLAEEKIKKATSEKVISKTPVVPAAEKESPYARLLRRLDEDRQK